MGKNKNKNTSLVFSKFPWEKWKLFSKKIEYEEENKIVQNTLCDLQYKKNINIVNIK